jgi:hypothetical protein
VTAANAGVTSLKDDVSSRDGKEPPIQDRNMKEASGGEQSKDASAVQAAEVAAARAVAAAAAAAHAAAAWSSAAMAASRAPPGPPQWLHTSHLSSTHPAALPASNTFSTTRNRAVTGAGGASHIGSRPVTPTAAESYLGGHRASGAGAAASQDNRQHPEVQPNPTVPPSPTPAVPDSPGPSASQVASPAGRGPHAISLGGMQSYGAAGYHANLSGSPYQPHQRAYAAQVRLPAWHAQVYYSALT